jgi:hypothetical protein
MKYSKLSDRLQKKNVVSQTINHGAPNNMSSQDAVSYATQYYLQFVSAKGSAMATRTDTQIDTVVSTFIGDVNLLITQWAAECSKKNVWSARNQEKMLVAQNNVTQFQVSTSSGFGPARDAHEHYHRAVTHPV